MEGALHSPMFVGHVRHTTQTETQSESRRRVFLSSQIRRLSKRMGFPFYTCSSALQLFHRFQLQIKKNKTRALPDFNDNDLVIACVFVACKVEETVKKARDLILGFNQINLRPGEEELEFDDPEVENQKRRVIQVERFMLEFICFDFHQLKNAHKNVIQIAKYLEIPQDVAQKAWNLADESYNTQICIQYPAHFIALASLFLACRLTDCDLIPVTMPSQFTYNLYCRLTGVLDISLLIIRHYQRTDELHETVDLKKLSDLQDLLEAQLQTALTRKIPVEVASVPVQQNADYPASYKSSSKRSRPDDDYDDYSQGGGRGEQRPAQHHFQQNRQPQQYAPPPPPPRGGNYPSGLPPPLPPGTIPAPPPTFQQQGQRNYQDYPPRGNYQQQQYQSSGGGNYNHGRDQQRGGDWEGRHQPYQGNQQQHGGQPQQQQQSQPGRISFQVELPPRPSNSFNGRHFGASKGAYGRR